MKGAKILLALIAFCIFSIALVSSGIFFNYSKSRIEFISGTNKLRGTLILPKGHKEPFPVVVFVHGDGAMPYDLYGYYHSIWEQLASHGIASFSWDKPGVGDSEGNWLSQDMDDRAMEVKAAFHSLSQTNSVDSERVGIIGFSQAGWVLPRLADENWVDYMIFVSTAINWIEQGRYLTRQRYLASGNSNESEIVAALEKNEVFNKMLLNPLLKYEDFLLLQEELSSGSEDLKPIGKDRFEFIKKNISEDSTQTLSKLKVPVLGLFGADDLNVDIKNSISVYQKSFLENNQVNFSYRIFPDATHGLSKTKYFNKQVPGLIDVLKINILGNELFADGVLESISSFARSGGV